MTLMHQKVRSSSKLVRILVCAASSFVLSSIELCATRDDMTVATPLTQPVDGSQYSRVECASQTTIPQSLSSNATHTIDRTDPFASQSSYAVLAQHSQYFLPSSVISDEQSPPDTFNDFEQSAVKQ